MWKQYSYIAHRIQGLQDWVNYLFLDVLFHVHDDFREDLMKVVDIPTQKLLDETKDTKFYNQLVALYKRCQKLDVEKIELLHFAFESNNQIERLCRKEIVPFRFKDLLSKYKKDKEWKSFLESLKTFCNALYSEYVYLKAFEVRYGTLKEYYNAMVKNDSICHCCGIGSVLTEDNTPRDAFDHYLPKAIYPFVSLNFKNLLPACYHCNSSYKQESDTLFEKVGKNEKQVKAFLPFSNIGDSHYHIAVDVKMATRYNREKTMADDIIVSCQCSGYSEEVQTWQRLYKINEQYVSFCRRSENLCLLNDMIERNLISPNYAESEIQKMERMPEVRGNFLFAPFARAVFRSLGVII